MRALAALLLLVNPVPATSPASFADEPAPFVDEQVIYQQRTFGYACFRIPAVVRATDGTVLAFAEGGSRTAATTRTSTSCCAAPPTAAVRGARYRWSPKATAARTATRCPLWTGGPGGWSW
ncbi:hypothetical protein Prum_060430 [Phytohabitans rumicis]|uniref:Uncharacterized protein n=1 Tax=Phytohabitans rumicis TaxID=1076125 RepID=A0A6V8LCA8_9ACTN|nr:sialidase family protein [Phytohabitans rumicis]GFJ92401.1 hypothetical protein Prum_060430 [Phytohabitans rumicis]